VNRLGYLAVGSAAILWAFGGNLARTLTDRGASTLEITEARAWIAVVVLGAIALARRGRDDGSPARPPRPHPVYFVVFGLSIAAANFFYYTAVSELPVAVAIVVQYTAPALVVVWLALAQRRRPSRRIVGALALSMAGVALLAELPRLVTTGSVHLSAGGMAAAGASAFAFATYIVVGERVEAAVGPHGALLRGFAVAGVFWIAVQAFRGRPDTLLDSSFLAGILALGILGTIVPFTLFVWGLGRIGASRAGVVSTLEPLSAAVIAYLWLGQTLGAVQIAGAALVLAGITVVQSEQVAPAPAPLE
jgi:drug/metabolite transporter (DMT)-like permease